MSNAITEIDNTDLVFIFGYNPADSHPIVANHILNAKRNGAKIIVCDPRKIETARIADLHLALKNGSNIALLNAIGQVIIEEDLYDKSFVAGRSEGFEAYRNIVEGYTPESVEAITGISARQIRECARLYARAENAMILWGMGVTQFWQGVETVRSLTSLAILTGNLGKPHVGVNPVRGQNNVQGACDMGALPDTYPGYQYVKFPENREKFANAWGVESLPENPGYRHQRAAAPRGARRSAGGVYHGGRSAPDRCRAFRRASGLRRDGAGHRPGYLYDQNRRGGPM
ncbi:formate dehydrogenase-H [Klebsiella michiganensis]|nr:formate dehydrogenase-H [Klebsiella michiganensis]